MSATDRSVLWVGPLAPWADALPGPLLRADAPSGDARAALVVLAGGIAGAEDWLRRPRTRPPALVVAADPAAEQAALEAGAEGVVAASATREEALREARRASWRHAAAQRDAELHHLMIESALDVVTVVDSTGRIVFASESARAQTGYTADELRAQGPFANIHPDDLDRIAGVFADGWASGEPVLTRYRAYRPDGEVRVFESVGRSVAGPDGEPFGIVTSRDVTARAATEERLSASEARFRAIVEALPDVVSRLRSDGQVLDFHVPAAFVTDYPAEQMVGRNLLESIPEDLAGKLAEALAEMERTQRLVTYSYAVESEGRMRHREVRMAPIGEGEVLSMLRDVTRLREHEAALEASQAELRALASHLQEVREDERTRLSREVHDVLGQQLTAIRLGVGWFGRHFPDDEAAQERLGDVRRTIDETIRHVRQIAADLRPGVLDDFGLASAVEWQAGRFEERTDVPCLVDVQGSAEPPTEVATAAFRVFQEALTNVARHAGARRVQATLVLSPAFVRMVVADDGAGFDPEATRRRALGLVGMRERAAALGGTLEVDSAPGQGTRIECTLPHPPPDADA